MSRQELSNWLQQVPSPGLLAFEQRQVEKWMPLVRGATVLQLGGLPGQFAALQSVSTLYYYQAPAEGLEGLNSPQLVASFEELSLRPESIDLVVLVHVLELVEHPTLLLKEVFDALAPNGKLLLFCLNSWSVAGLQQRVSRAPAVYAGARFYSPGQLQRWLTSLGFSSLKDKTLGFCSLRAQAPQQLDRLVLLEALGQLTVPMLGAVNVFLVEKRVYAGLASLRYHWQHGAQQA